MVIAGRPNSGRDALPSAQVERRLHARILRTLGGAVCYQRLRGQRVPRNARFRRSFEGLLSPTALIRCLISTASLRNGLRYQNAISRIPKCSKVGKPFARSYQNPPCKTCGKTSSLRTSASVCHAASTMCSACASGAVAQRVPPTRDAVNQNLQCRVSGL
jgi:hypothetical protein